jgi:hypothetical protein
MAPASFVDGFGPAIGIAAALSLMGAIIGLALSGRRAAVRVSTAPALQPQA